jgi:hypothetical protein
MAVKAYVEDELFLGQSDDDTIVTVCRAGFSSRNSASNKVHISNFVGILGGTWVVQ